MKKLIVLIIAVLFIFTACDATGQNAPGQQESQQQQEQQEDTAPESAEASKEAAPESAEASEEPSAEELPDKVAIVVCRDSYAPSEFHPVIDTIIGAGYKPVVTSDELGDADGGDEKVGIDATFSDFTGSDLRGIVIIGGSDSLWENAELHRLLNEVYDQGRVVAGICLNAVTLAKAGIIKAGDEACWANHETITDPVMAELGVIDSGLPVTVNGNVITGNGPPASDEFAAEVVKALDAL